MGKHSTLINTLFVDGKLNQASYDALVKASRHAVGPLADALRGHIDAKVRETCAEILGERKEHKTIPFLIEALLDESLYVRHDAFWAIEAASGYVPGALSEWLDVYFDDPEELYRKVTDWWERNKEYIERMSQPASKRTRRMNNKELFLEGDRLHDEGDFSSALDMFLKAASNGDTSSMLRIALMYALGEGVRCDYDKAEEWELKAIEAGDSMGKFNLAITYRMKGDLRKSKAWFHKALESGDGAAALELAQLYLVSEKETETVRSYLKQAIALGNMCEADVEKAEKLLSEL